MIDIEKMQEIFSWNGGDPRFEMQFEKKLGTVIFLIQIWNEKLI
jgi:hypothetical protein